MSLYEALVDAVPLLRRLPRTDPLDEGALAQLAAFRAAHPEVAADLVIDRQPGHPDVDFDLLLQDDSAGTIAIGWRPDRAMPWSVQYSEHWASNFVLSVNGRDLTIPEALQALRLNEEAGPDLATALVNYCLITAHIAHDPPPVSDSELQNAADGFRAARGLHDAESTDRWLVEVGLSIARFEELMKARVQARKFRDRLTADQVEPYFATHIDSFAKVTVIRMHATSIDALQTLTRSNVAIGDFVQRALTCQSVDADLGITMVIETGLMEDVLPMLFAEATVPTAGTIVGPLFHCGEYCLAQVLQHTPAKLDQETYKYIRERLFASWLEAERANAQIRWHWM
jgi:putative peptide maturation system protein